MDMKVKKFIRLRRDFDVSGYVLILSEGNGFHPCKVKGNPVGHFEITAVIVPVKSFFPQP